MDTLQTAWRRFGHRLRSSLALGCTAVGLAWAPAHAADKPNIVLIVSDDFGYGDAGAYGGGANRGMPTPALDRMAGEGILRALDSLDPRSRRIVEERWLKVNDDSSGGMTLHELAAEYGVSAERIRQIEVAAMKKMRKTLELSA